nr:hypothetical protein [uncultured Acetatifactor sp.]
MERMHEIDGLILERKHIDARIVDSPYGYKMVVPLFNEAMPAFYVGKVLETIAAFLDAYMIACGISLRPDSLYVDGNVSVCLSRDIPIEQRYRLYVVIVLEEGSGLGAQDYIIEVPIVPTDEHFAEFRQCFLDAFEAMVGDR